MQKFIIGLLCVGLLFQGSVIYKQYHTMVCRDFPIPANLKTQPNTVPFYLFLFFSKSDCYSCVTEIVEVLKSLPSQFCLAGIVPGDELKNDRQLQPMVGGRSFPLYSWQKFEKYLTGHSPTLFGVSPMGRIVLVLPIVQGEGQCLANILLSTYSKLLPSFEKEYSQLAKK